MAGSVLGLDLGSHALKALLLRESRGGLAVERIWSIPPPAGPGTGAALGAALGANRVPLGRVVVALPGDRVTGRLLELPAAPPRALAKAVPFEVAANLPFPPETAVVAWQESGRGEHGRVRVTAAVALRADVARLLADLDEAGVDPAAVAPEGFVLAELAPLLGDGAAGGDGGRLLLVDLGHRKTTLALLAGGRPLLARTVALGAAAIGGPDGVARLSAEVARTLGREPAARLVLLGGGARRPGVAEALGASTGHPVSPAEMAGVGLPAGFDAATFGPALALALAGTRRARTAMDLRQAELASPRRASAVRQQARRAVALAAAALVLAGVGTAASVGAAWRREARARGETLRAFASVLPGRPVPGDPLRALREAEAEALRQAEFLGLGRGPGPAPDGAPGAAGVLAEIAALAPVDVSFEEVSIDPDEARVAGQSSSFEAIDRFRKALAGSPALGAAPGAALGPALAPGPGDVELSEVVAVGDGGAKSFRLRIDLGGSRREAP